MNNTLNKSFRHILRSGLLCLIALSFETHDARAGLSLTIDLYRTLQAQTYVFYTPLATNAVAPAAALGTYVISSPGWPASGSRIGFEMTSSGLNDRTEFDSENSYGDFNSAMQQITNGTWSILFTNTTTTNLYTFTVSAPTINSNLIPATIITFPSDGALNIANQPTFTWQGPTGWPVNPNPYVANRDFSFYQPASIPAAQTYWTIPTPIPNGMNCAFRLNYVTNYTTSVFVAATPLSTNAGHAAISGWASATTLETGDGVSFAVTNPPSAGITLIAHYTFDNSGNLGQDTSGHGYDLNYNGGNSVTSSGTAKAGSGAANFDGGSFFSYTSTPGAVLSALAGDFSLSFWLKTTQNDGNENGQAWAGAGIVAADVPGVAYDLVPAALDGGQIGFNTGGTYGDDTVNSTADINNGSYHHVVITRQQTTGVKQIYIDGVLNNSQTATMNPLTDPHLVAIGCAIDASQSNPGSANTSQFFLGLLDDLQLYSGVLSAGEVASLFANPGSTAASGGGHKNVAHYTFDNSSSLGQDSSGNGNDMSGEVYWGPQHQFDTNAEAGGGAVRFFGTDAIFPYDQALTNLNAVLAGSFSFSAWVKTTVTNGADYNNAFYGAAIFWAYNDHGNTNDTIPLAITGSKAAFTTRDHLGNFDTLHSITSVNDGNYHLITVTRSQATGEKKIYVDGNFETSEIGTTDPLNGDNYNLTIGGEAYLIDSAATNYSSYKGLLDDLQIYSGVLSGSDVAYLYSHPGSNVLDTTGQDFNAALNTTGLAWEASGNSDWFVETTNTHDNVSAAQNGSVTGNQSSTLSVTITGPGTLTFYWSSIANDPNQGFDYEFYMDDPISGDMADLYGDNGWAQAGPFTIPAGQHTLGWTVFAYGDTDLTQAGFLDQVSFVPAPPLVITLNPFNQTNYPGYNVALLAAATSNAAITWQWYKVGPGLIANATNSFFSPTNSGTAGVAGNYYAVASNSTGSATTLTAAVTFVSAPLPPAWSRAFRSPFYPANDTAFSDYNGGCVVDSAGDVYTANQYIGNVNVENSQAAIVKTLTTVGANGAAALIKYADTNVPLNASPLLWAVGLTNNDLTSYSYADCVALAPGNGAYLASVLVGTNWLGTNKFSNNGGASILLSRFDASGSNIWSRLIGTTNQVFPAGYNDLIADASGNVTVAGIITGSADFGGIILTAPSGYAGFMAQYNSNGVVRWAQVFPGFLLNMASGGGQIYVATSAGTSGGTTNLSLGSLSNLTDRAYGVGAVNASTGQALWLHGAGEQYGANGVNDAPLISVSGSDVFLTGTANGSTAVFGNLSVSLTGGRCQYFARYDTNGNPQVATTFGSPTTMPWASTANASGVYISGDFDGYADFGNLFITAPEYFPSYLGTNYFTQAFVAKFDRNGNPLWARNGVSPVLANFRGVATTSNGVWVSGFLDVTTDPYNNIVPAQFGTNSIISDFLLVGSPIGSFVFSRGGMLAKISETTAASPVTLLNPQTVGANFQFQFLSQAGFNHNILYRTNLVVGNWRTNSSVAGDGTLKTISIPLSVFSPSKQGFVRVTTE